MSAAELPRPGAVRRKAMSVSAPLCGFRTIAPARPLPLIVEPRAQGVKLEAWVRNHRDLVESKLVEHGGVLFRGFGISSASDFDACISAMGKDLLDYVYASTPRTRVSGKIYTSTEYPADQSIPLHNENAYARAWPMKLWFYCETPAGRGGQTPLADSREVTKRIPERLRERFRELGVMYVRNYGHGLDLPWQAVFATEDESEVERFCRASGLELEWHADGGLTTKQVCQALATHPRTGEEVWFNQAHLFHVSAHDEVVRDSLLSTLGEARLPRNAYFGDGSALDPNDLDAVRAAFAAESVEFEWERGDVLVVDNMLTAHGRTPYEGARKILVGMTDVLDETARRELEG